jgi:hypothetical protein
MGCCTRFSLYYFTGVGEMMQLSQELDTMLTIFILLSLLLAGLALASFLKFLIEATYKSVKRRMIKR